MLDPESDVAERLANALRQHQKNRVEKDQEEKNVEVLRRLLSQLETGSEDSGKDD
jgi:hypothetical protein